MRRRISSQHRVKQSVAHDIFSASYHAIIQNYNSTGHRDQDTIIQNTDQIGNQSPLSVLQTVQSESLAFLIHFMGDIVQPLHVSESLQGGNALAVRFGNHLVNMHTVWDTLLIQQTIHLMHDGISSLWMTNLAQGKVGPSQLKGAVCAATLNPAHVESIVKCANLWAQETNKIVCAAVYPFDFKEHLTMDTSVSPYADRAMEFIHLQLMRGGLRLAALLNNIFRESSIVHE
jgi:hypothetical protein